MKRAIVALASSMLEDTLQLFISMYDGIIALRFPVLKQVEYVVIRPTTATPENNICQ